MNKMSYSNFDSLSNLFGKRLQIVISTSFALFIFFTNMALSLR